jgi:hypothetical protein
MSTELETLLRNLIVFFTMQPARERSVVVLTKVGRKDAPDVSL